MPAGVLLDATPLSHAHALRGIGAAVGGLLAGFRELDVAARPTLLIRREQKQIEGFAHREVRWPRWRGYRIPDPWPRSVGERVVRRREQALFHATQPALVPAGQGVVVTLYDLIPAVYWSDYLGGAGRAPERRAYCHFLERVASADAVIAISQETADDATRLLDLDPERIHVVPLACPPQAAAEGSTPSGQYVLYAGGLEPHKNAALLIDAMARVDAGARLVMVGAWSKRRLARLKRRARKSGSAGRIDWLGHVSAGRLSALRREAAAVLVPSRKEGFGLPVLEAMAAGRPVVASDTPAIREVGGDAVTYLPPEDPAPWAAQIDAIAEDAALRRTMSSRGTQRAREFSWRATAEAIRAVYLITQERLDAA